jgi:type I restriction enzyme M protein
LSKKQAEQPETTLQAGYLLDYLTNEPIKETPKEQVRQWLVRALIHEYGFDPRDMKLDFPIGGRKKIDIAIFHHDKEHSSENLSRAVICRPEPKIGAKTVRIRDHEQAVDDLEGIKNIMMEVQSVKYGMWTNRIDQFFLEKKERRFETVFNPIGDWPFADDSVQKEDVVSDAHTRIADPDMLKITFRRCHNYIHGNEGMPKDAAFWQFLYLIFCKMYDEEQRIKQKHTYKRRFWASVYEPFDETGAGQKAIRLRIEGLFKEVKKQYKNIFQGNEELILSDKALAFIVSELANYDFLRSSIDAKGAAYQELAGVNLRGDRGQYFTPRGVIDLMVKMLDPKDGQTVLDPACGTGGFLVSCVQYAKKRIERKYNKSVDDTQEFLSVTEELRDYTSKYLYGADFDPFLIRATQMNMVMSGDGKGHIYHINSLEFPKGHLVEKIEQAEKERNKKEDEDTERIQIKLRLDSFDIVMTNPPFGSDIPITDKKILEHFELARRWEPDGQGGFRNAGTIKPSVSPEILFLERCIKWLKPGTGKLGIVLPDGILGNPADEYIRWWIMRETQVLASVDLPVEAFIAEANVNILTSLLFLRRKSQKEKRNEALRGPEEYQVFMAVVDKVGMDRRGNKLYKRSPDGEYLIESVEETERIRIGGRYLERKLTRRKKIPDNDLLVVSEKYKEFLKEYD